MASPMIDGRSLNPREKAHFSLHLGDRITKNDPSLGTFNSVKYNHKPSQTTSARTTRLTPASGDRYTLQIQDRDEGKVGDVFTFTGQKTAPKKSYILLFDSTTQKATLEPLDSTYTFNVSTRGKTDITATYPKIYPRKEKDEQAQDTQGTDDLFDEGGKADDENDEPDPDNPYDFRHFLAKEKEKRGDESEYNNPSSPEYKAGTGSARNTPSMPARKQPAAATSRLKTAQAPAKPRKRKSPEPDPLVSRKAATKKSQGTPAVRLDRRASTHPKPDARAKSKTIAPSTAKVKSTEMVHSSDESDADAEGEAASSPLTFHRSPEPTRTHHASDDEDEDASMGGGGLEIEVPDARPKPRALASVNLGGLSHLRSPSNGPISLASAANSVEGSPDPAYNASRKSRHTDDVIDFDTRGGNGSEEEEGGYEEDAEGEDEDEDRDVGMLDIGPPAQQTSSGANVRKMSVGGLAAEEDEDDPLFKQMMEGLAGGDSSEESEEE